MPEQNVSNGAYKEQIGISSFLIQRTDNKDPGGVYFEFTGVNAGFLGYSMASVEGGNGVLIMLNSGDDQNGIGKEISEPLQRCIIAKAVKTILNLAITQHPNSSMVDKCWGGYYLKLDHRQNAIKSYKKALELDPTDQQTKETLNGLTK